MINKLTGDISFPAWTDSLRLSISRTEFISSSLAQGAQINTKNEPCCSWHLSPAEWQDKRWQVTVCFVGEQLDSVHIMADAPEFGTSWSNWSEEQEMKRKKYHESILKPEIGSTPQTFTWGTVQSPFEPRGGMSSIIIEAKKKSD